MGTRTIMRSSGFAIALSVTLLAYADVASARDYSVVDVVGDSVSAGVNPDYYSLLRAYGWVHMLYGSAGATGAPPALTITNVWPGVVRYNSAVSGSKASEWANTNSYSYMATVTNHHPDLVFVMIGGNDALAYTSDGVFTEQEKSEFQTNLTHIVEILQTNTPIPDIVLIGYYDLLDGYSSNLPPAYASYAILSQATVEGNRIIKQIAEARHCFFVSIYESFMHHCYGAELGDTGHIAPNYVRTPLTSLDIHPVTTGHRAIYERIYAQLLDLDEIPKFTRISMESNHVLLGWSSSMSQKYVLEQSASLTQTNWITLPQTNAGLPPENLVTNSAGASQTLFYRIRVLD
jgi:lysophospholipase L1-like esterase